MIYNLGRVVPLFKGNYDAATTYGFLDVVYYDNSSFVALDTTTGNLPTDTTHWLPVALKGTTQNPTPAQMQQIFSEVENYMHGTDFVYDPDYTHIDVINNLTSTSTTNALSANQGKVLNETIDDVSHTVSDLSNTVSNLVVDNLSTDDGTKALSAKQGKYLDEDIKEKEFILNRNKFNHLAAVYSSLTPYTSLDVNGNVVSSANSIAKTSDFININEGSVFVYKGTSVNGTTPNIAGYDENNTFIFSIVLPFSTTNKPERIFVLPNEVKKIRVAYYNNNTDDALFEYTNSSKYAYNDFSNTKFELLSSKIPLQVVDISNSVAWNNSKKISLITGTIDDYTSTNNLQKVSDEIQINPNNVYIYYGFSITNNMYDYALYDENHNFIEGAFGTTSGKRKHIIQPPVNAKYIRVSYYIKAYTDYLQEISFDSQFTYSNSVKIDAIKNGYTLEYLFNSEDSDTYDFLVSGQRIYNGAIQTGQTSIWKTTPVIQIDNTKIYHYKGQTADSNYQHILSYDVNDNVVDKLWIQAQDDFDIKFSKKAVKFVAGFYNPEPARTKTPSYWQCLYTISVDKNTDNYKSIKKVDEEIVQLGKINHWKGKIMCAFGASGTYGATSVSFPIEVGKILDCTVRNFAKYSGGTRYYDTAMDGNGNITRCGLSSTIAEYTAIGGTAYSANTWENAFTTDLDLVIFGEGDSNCPGGDELIELIQLPTQNNKHFTYSNGDTLEQHRNSYIGALVYLLDKLWGINPACRVVFTNDYLYIGDYSTISGLRNRTKALCEKLCLPNIQIWQKLGWSWYNQHIYMSHTSNPNDTVHPNELGTKKVAQIYANELLLIS